MFLPDWVVKHLRAEVTHMSTPVRVKAGSTEYTYIRHRDSEVWRISYPTHTCKAIVTKDKKTITEERAV